MVVAVLQDYIKKIKSLGRYKDRAPYKPFLLLAVIELIERGNIYENKIVLSENLKETFKKYVSLTPDWNPKNIHDPFFYLKSDGFWHLYPKEVKNARRASYAKLDDPLFLLLTNSGHREIIRQEIIGWYFAALRPDIEGLIETQRRSGSEQMEADVEHYSEGLIERAERPFSPCRPVESIQVEVPIRSAGFRRAIMKIYDWTCAVCELNIRALRGESVTDAAHIIPFSVSYNDDIRNGISLCKSHHWAFDTGLISLDDDYQVIVSPSMSEQGPTDGMLTQLRNKRIWLPRGEEYRPAQDALEWHRVRVLRG